MMTRFFPLRTRYELKAKFKREDRRNSLLVSRALECQSFQAQDLEEWGVHTTTAAAAEKAVENVVEEDQRLEELPPHSIFTSMEKTPYNSPGKRESNAAPRRGRPPSLLPRVVSPCPRAMQIASEVVEGMKLSLKGEEKQRRRKTEKKTPLHDKCKNKKELLPILRFDPGDPLGLKVAVAEGQQPFPIEDPSPPQPPIRPPPKKRNPRRVPGPGQAPASNSNQMVDEIEIEIDCG